MSRQPLQKIIVEIPEYYKQKATRGEKLKFYTKLCKSLATDKGQIFLGFTVGIEDFNIQGKCKLFCKTSNIVWETTTINRYLRSFDCSCDKCYRIRLDKRAKITKGIKNKHYLKYGVGYNDLTMVTDYSCRSCPFYLRWHDLLKRCYDYDNQKESYIGVTVCKDWLTFSIFKSWMELQDWVGKDLDKDLIVEGNKVYSPSTAIFIHSKVNQFLKDRGNYRGYDALGVIKTSSGNYEASISNTFTDTQEFLGTFYSEKSAHFAWKRRKHELAILLANSDYVTDEKVRTSLLHRYEDVTVLESRHLGLLIKK